MSVKKINIHLISDSTGETLSSVSRAALSQFENVESNDFIWSLIRTKTQISEIMNSISANPGIVMYTILHDDLIAELKKKCSQLNIPCIPVLSHIIGEFSKYLDMNISNTVGRQHLLDNEYFSRVDAISYSMTHDDGQSLWDLYDADIIIIGVSRTSKSPTSIYLSCRGYKVANIPFVSMDVMPNSIFELQKPLIVGLTINPDKLSQIRSNRISQLGAQDSSDDYINIDKIRCEINESRKLFAKLNCPIIDVTKKSVEETAAKIIKFFQEGRNNN